MSVMNTHWLHGNALNGQISHNNIFYAEYTALHNFLSCVVAVTPNASMFSEVSVNGGDTVYTKISLQ